MSSEASGSGSGKVEESVTAESTSTASEVKSTAAVTTKSTMLPKGGKLPPLNPASIAGATESTAGTKLSSASSSSLLPKSGVKVKVSRELLQDWPCISYFRDVQERQVLGGAHGEAVEKLASQFYSIFGEQVSDVTVDTVSDEQAKRLWMERFAIRFMA